VFGTGDVPNQLVVSKVEQEGTPVYATHVSLQQMYGGLPVFGATLQVHLNPALAITSIGGRYVRDPRVVPQTRVSEQAAADTAIRLLRSERAARGIADDPARELKALGVYVYPSVLRGDAHLRNAVAYRFQFADAEVFVGEGSGEQVAAVVAVHPQQASIDRVAMDAGGASQLSFPARVAVNGVATGGGPLSADAAAVDPLANVALSMFTRFGRDSYDGRGSDVVAVTNSSLALTGGCGARAQWDFVRNWMWFCPGNVVGDVLTHELGHGVATSSAFLLPIDETGALGEHYGDVFGALAFPDPAGLWQIGESLAGGPLRDMVTQTPLTYSGFVPRGAGCTAPEDVFKNACDGGHVHTNCAIGNHAAVFLADGDGVPGSAHPGIGRDRLGRLFMGTLTHRMHPWSTYIDERLNTWQAARDLAAAGVQVANTAPGASSAPGGGLLPFDTFVADEVGWAFNRVGVDPRLIAGWFSVPVGVSGGSGTITFYGGQMLPACWNVSDIELQVRVFDPFGASLPWWTGSSRLSGPGAGAVTFPGGIFGAAITASAVGSPDKSTTVRYFHSGFLPMEINVVIIPAQDPACMPDGGTILPDVSEVVSSGTTHWSFAVGGKGDDNLNTGGLMVREPNLGKGCPITDAFVDLLDRDGTVLGTSSLGGPPVVKRYGWFDALSFGAQLTAANINTTNPAATVHWSFDVGSAVRYQVRYFATGSSCSIQ
jgi:hypothetical protein